MAMFFTPAQNLRFKASTAQADLSTAKLNYTIGIASMRVAVICLPASAYSTTSRAATPVVAAGA